FKDVDRAHYGVIIRRRDDDRVPADPGRGAETVTRSTVGGSQFPDFAPVFGPGFVPLKDIGRAFFRVVTKCPHADRVAADRDRVAELVTRHAVRGGQSLDLA